MTAPLIGLLGRKRSGKDSVASVLVEEGGFVRFAFADPLRAALLDLDPFIRVEDDEKGPLSDEIGFVPGETRTMVRLAWLVEAVGWERAKELREVRRLLQAHGHSIREQLGREVWVDATMVQIRHCPRCLPYQPTVITDVRYPNEAEAIMLAGGTLVRVLRPDLVSTDSHVSETGLDGWTVDEVILNDGTLDELREKARRLLVNS